MYKLHGLYLNNVVPTGRISLGKVFAVHAVGRCRALRGEAYLVSAVGLVQGVHDRHDPRMFVPVNRVEHIDLYSFVRPNIRKNHARTFVAVAFGVQVPQYLARIFYQFDGAVCRVGQLQQRIFIALRLVGAVAVRQDEHPDFPADGLLLAQLFGAGGGEKRDITVQFAVIGNVVVKCSGGAYLLLGLRHIIKPYTSFAPQLFPHAQSRNAAHVQVHPLRG